MESTGIPLPAPLDSPVSHRFVVRAAELLHAYGTPAHRLELVLEKVARSVGVRASFLATPTAVMASFGEGNAQVMKLIRADSGEINLGKLVEFDEVLDDVAGGDASIEEGLSSLDRIAGAPPRFGFIASGVCWGAASAGAAVFFGGTPTEVQTSFAIGILVSLLARVLPRSPSSVGAFEPVAAFLAATAAIFAVRIMGHGDHKLITVASLIILIPGLTLTIGFTELAARHLVSGMARIAGAGAVFLTILLGVGLAWRCGDLIFGTEALPLDEGKLPGWALPCALAIVPVAFAILFETRPKEWPITYVAGVLGYLAARAGIDLLGPELGPFLGGLTVGVISNFYARHWDRPALVPMTPGVLLLVPGSIGFGSLTSLLESHGTDGLTGAFQTGLIAVSLVGGLLVANLILQPRRVL